jgi:tetratricopeptide (TPR) repeat protein
MTEDDAAEAERFMRRAIKSDKTFAAPWAGLAMVLHFQTDFLWTDEKGSLWPEALEAARKAIKLDERDALAYAVMARILLAGKKLPEAIHAAQRAVGHNDNSSFANMTMSFVLSASGRASEAFSHAELALRLSPRDPMRWAFEITRGLALVALRRYEESEQSLKTASLYDQAGFWPHVHLANLYVLMGRIEDARKSVRQAMAMRPGLTISHVITTSAVAGKKGYEHYLENLKLVGLPE